MAGYIFFACFVLITLGLRFSDSIKNRAKEVKFDKPQSVKSDCTVKPRIGKERENRHNIALY